MIGSTIVSTNAASLSLRTLGQSPLGEYAVLVLAFSVILLLVCIGAAIWAMLPRRSARDDHIERQIATLRKGADHSVTHRPRVRANGCSQPPATHIKAAPKKVPDWVNNGSIRSQGARYPSAPKPCGGGLCRHRADCADHYCPGRVAASIASLDHAAH